MKQLLFSFIAFVLTVTTLAQPGADWKDQKLKGKVKSISTLQNYRYKKNGVDFTPWEKQYTEIYAFNTTGRYTLFQQLLANGTQNYRIEYSYLPKERKTIQQFYNKDNQPTIRKEMIYNEKNLLTEIIEFTKEGARDRSYRYNYDARGNKISLIYLATDGKIGSTTSWKYDSKNNMTEVMVETPGYATSFKKYAYDAQGNCIEESWYYDDEKVTFRFVRAYDDKGNCIEERKYKDGTTEMDKVTWIYNYDKQGNWIKRTQYTRDGVDFNIHERTITYF